MSEVAVMLAKYREVRQRLTFPANAVPDMGIDLKRPKAITAPTEGPPPPQEENTPHQIEPEPATIVPLEATPMSDPPLGGILTFSSTVKATADEFGVTAQDIKNKCRKREFVNPRHVAIYLGCLQKRKIAWMGRFLDMDHTSIIYARNRVCKLLENDPELALRIKTIEERLRVLHSSTLPANHQYIMESGPQ